MLERKNYMLCCGCGFAVKEETMFKKIYKNTAICLCRKCAVQLLGEIEENVKLYNKRMLCKRMEKENEST